MKIRAKPNKWVLSSNLVHWIRRRESYLGKPRTGFKEADLLSGKYTITSAVDRKFIESAKNFLSFFHYVLTK